MMQMKLTQLTLIATLLFSLTFGANSQEVRGLNYNPALIKANTKSKLKSTQSSAAISTVPLLQGNLFFDDFSTYHTEIFPNTKGNWIDPYATITRSYADSSISIGVVTLDCFDNEGKVYGPTGRVNPSDTLTSKKIVDVVDDNLYLSFFLQGGGKADPPEAQDSIKLEFLSGKTGNWIYVWDSNGYKSRNFSQVIIPIHDSLYTDSTIQFRFINYTSLSANEVQGKNGALSNADNWHIDYVQIKSAANIQSIQNINDVTIYRTLAPILKNYTHIPYDHLKYTTGKRIEDNTIWFRTYFPSLGENISVGRSHVYIDVVNNDTCEIVGKNDGIQSDAGPFSFVQETDKFFLSQGFKTEKYPDQQGEGIYNFKAYLTVTSDQVANQYKWNDTVTTEDQFRDFYAYDDGSAEHGFGIAGADAYNTAFASRFEVYHLNNTPDTLTGVYLYFNHAAYDYNLDLEFEVGVWAVGEGNLPGDLIYSTGFTNLYTPDTNTSLNNPSNSTNGFMLIEFEEEVIAPNNFYIGLIQYTNEFLNVGYDVSFGTKSNIMYYSDNQWRSASDLQGIPEGSLMIRPKFGHYNYTSNKKIKQGIKELDLYPNPASTSVHFNLPNTQNSYHYKIYNILGKEIDSDNLSSTSINIENLEAGLYIVQLRDLTSHQIYSQKLLKK